MGYLELVDSGASITDIQKYLVDGEMTAITIRIPKNLRDSAKEVAEIKGMSFSSLIRGALIRELTHGE
jgi:predicted DNA binding CopG/RHH family protein